MRIFFAAAVVFFGLFFFGEAANTASGTRQMVGATTTVQNVYLAEAKQYVRDDAGNVSEVDLTTSLTEAEQEEKSSTLLGFIRFLAFLAAALLLIKLVKGKPRERVQQE